MIISWRPALPLFLIAALIVHEDRVSIPSCETLPGADFSVNDYDPDDLRVMMVANLHLLGSDGDFVNTYFRNYYLSKFFKKSFQSLKPDMLLVLGDLSAKGLELTKSKWLFVLHEFHKILGPFLGFPFHVILGDRDVGECSGLNSNSVHWLASNFPGLDSAGCGAFDISNISFVSLNAVALLCGNNDLRFSVEKVIEVESIDLRMEIEGTAKATNDPSKFRKTPDKFGWRENAMSSGSGPVLLLHVPLHRTTRNDHRGTHVFRTSSHSLESSFRGIAEVGPYDLLKTLPPNATEYIFQALKPSIVFSAHSHEFEDYTHSDGTREVTVPAMTWNARNDPGFIVATFRGNRRAVSISYCSLARETDVLMVYASMVFISMSTLLAARILRLRRCRLSG